MPDPTTALPAGRLYVVATPIGNLEDITLRALRVLKTVNLVAAEDTRRTGNLLRHYEIRTPILSVHEHNERSRASSIIARLAAGESIALVTDAGTPAISDPGGGLVAAVRSAGFTIEPIPGPSAVLAALSASGLQSEGFAFVGFPPNRLNTRNAWWSAVVAEAIQRPVVLFEAPHRLQRTLGELSLLVNRPIIAFRELTKVHEEARLGTPSELAAVFSEPRGEFTLVIPQQESVKSASEPPTDSEIAAEFGQTTDISGGTTKREAIRRVASKLGLSPKAVYAALERAKVG